MRRLRVRSGAAIAGSVLLVALLAGCGALASSDPSDPSDPGGTTGGGPGIAGPELGAPEPMEPGAQPGAVPDAPAEDGGGDGLPSAGVGDEASVIVSGTLAMRAADPIGVADAVADAAEARGGGVEQRSEGASTDFEPAWATLVVRVPAAEVEGLLTALRGLGEVARVDLGEQDVSAQVRDLAVRVDAARASVERLTALLASAADTETLLEVEAQLTQRTAELEQLLSEQRAIEDAVAMSTIGVDIRSTTVAGPTGTPTFWDGLAAGWAAFLAWGAALLFGLGQSVPGLVLLLVLGGAGWLVVRAVLRRRGARGVAAPRPEAPVENPLG